MLEGVQSIDTKKDKLMNKNLLPILVCISIVFLIKDVKFPLFILICPKMYS